MYLTAALFYTLAVLAGFSAVAVVVTQNIVRAATWLLFALAATAGVYFLLGALFVGGTLVLVVFGVMLTAQGPFITMRISAAEWAVAMCVGLLFYGVLAFSLYGVESPTGATHKEPGEQLASPLILGGGLLGIEQVTPPHEITSKPDERPQRRRRVGYLLPFEIISVHLLVVLIGAAYLARAKRRRILAQGPTSPTGAPS
jgi:NADH-quinone oxidoreductase subunit J